MECTEHVEIGPLVVSNKYAQFSLVSPANNEAVAAWINGTDGKLRIKTLVGGTWTELSHGMTELVRQIDLFVDDNNKVHVAFATNDLSEIKNCVIEGGTCMVLPPFFNQQDMDVVAFDVDHNGTQTAFGVSVTLNNGTKPAPEMVLLGPNQLPWVHNCESSVLSPAPPQVIAGSASNLASFRVGNMWHFVNFESQPCPGPAPPCLCSQPDPMIPAEAESSVAGLASKGGWVHTVVEKKMGSNMEAQHHSWHHEIKKPQPPRLVHANVVVGTTDVVHQGGRLFVSTMPEPAIGSVNELPARVFAQDNQYDFVLLPQPQPPKRFPSIPLTPGKATHIVADANPNSDRVHVLYDVVIDGTDRPLYYYSCQPEAPPPDGGPPPLFDGGSPPLFEMGPPPPPPDSATP